MRKPFIAGNWKMFKNKGDAKRFAEEFSKLYQNKAVDTAICAPFVHLEYLKEAFKGTGIKVGAQNVHHMPEGAYTGEISVGMLKSCNVDYCIIGHSERRQYFGETNEDVRQKIRQLVDNGIKPIMCVGENLEEREKDMQFQVVGRQMSESLVGFTISDLKDLTIAYEPIWAIGTGKTATAEQANEMCALIRGILDGMLGEYIAENTRIQYGGSVKPGNIKELMAQPEIDGALVGGASLIPEDFNNIIEFDK
ncbi:MAG: triose-phosphate isomerase [Firmicutes bacterium]|nr:triose-phosphate isomerase [Bacillota bacterium]